MEKPKRKRIIRFILLSVILIFLCSVLIFALYYASVAKEIDYSLYDIEGKRTYTRFFAEVDGEYKEIEELRLYSNKISEYKTIDEMPNNLINAFIAIEDKRFNEHNGVDIIRTIEASLNYLMKIGDKFGASTITQQLVKNITEDDEYSVKRKLDEMITASELEKNFSKEEIIEMYLNVINLSEHCYGVGSASRRYFSKDVKDLTLSECAIIASITNNPSLYDPITYPENNIERRNLILLEMKEQNLISEDEYNNEINEPLNLNIDESIVVENTNSWYVDTVIEDVINDFVENKNYTREKASDLIYNGGLDIYIEADLTVQKILEDYYSDASNFSGNEGAESAIIVISKDDGAVLGIVGGVGEKSGNRILNRATDTLRPPGSTIKPIAVYAPALEEGIINYASVYDDTPLTIENGVCWPKNANGIYNGLSSMSYALKNSTNTVALKVLNDYGIEQSYNFLTKELGFNTLVDGEIYTDKNLASLGLGQLTYGITLREISGSYSIFADNGNLNKTRTYTLVKDFLGNILLENKKESKKVLSDETVSIMTKLLSEVVEDGTAKDLTSKNIVALAGKTGTSQDNKDRWCIAYTPSFIVGVWYGYDTPSEIPRSEKNIFLDALDNAIYEIYNENVFDLKKDSQFSYDKDLIEVEYCMDSGKLLTEACKKDPRGCRACTGLFKKGTEPKEECDTHILVKCDKVCGGIATSATPKNHIEEYGLLLVDRHFCEQITVSDAQYVYMKVDLDFEPDTRSNSPYFATLEKNGYYFGRSDTSLPFNRLCTSHISFSDYIFRLKKKYNLL